MASKAKALPPKPADSVEFFDDVEQLSDEWWALRLGMPTASRFHAVMAGGEGKMRDDYMRRLAGELITGEPNETFRNEAMDRGRAMEPAIREHYERLHLVDLEPVGFAKRTCAVSFGGAFFAGCSPDSKIKGRRKGLEIKSMRPDLLIAVKQRGAAGFPSEHRAQCQGAMFVCDWDEIDLYLGYVGRLGTLSAKFTVVRDEVYIRQLRDQLERFCYELARMVEQMRR